MPLLVSPTNDVTRAPLRISPPLGLRGSSFVTDTFSIPHGAGMILISDGVVERRHEDLRDGLGRLAVELTPHGSYPTAEAISASVVDSNLDDHTTIVAIYRDEENVPGEESTAAASSRPGSESGTEEGFDGGPR
jgi:two-component system, chemotaxis family, sensor kinase Cph1